MPASAGSAGASSDAPAPSLIARIAEAMAAAGDVVKDARNTDQNYNYASVESMLRAVRAPLFERGIVLFQHPRPDLEREEPITSRNSAKGVRVIVGYDFAFVDGQSGQEYRVEGWTGEGVDYGDKAYAKARTNAIKTFVRGQWLLAVDDASDAERDSLERVADTAGGARRGATAPAWATLVRDKGRKAEVVTALRELLDGAGPADRVEAAVQSLGRSIADTFGGVPEAVAGALVAAGKTRAVLREATAAPAPATGDELEPTIPPTEPEPLPGHGEEEPLPDDFDDELERQAQIDEARQALAEERTDVAPSDDPDPEQRPQTPGDPT